MSYRDKLKGIFLVKDTPHRISIAFALGVFLGISPFLGFHTVGAFFLAWLLGLNRLVAIVGVYVTNPWTIVPIYSFNLWIGIKMIGINQALPDVDWQNLTIMYLINHLTPLIVPFIAGSIIVGAVAGIVSYFIISGLIIKYRKVKHYES